MSDVTERFREIEEHVNYMKQITPIGEGVLYIGDALWLIDTVKQQQEQIEQQAIDNEKVSSVKDQRIEELEQANAIGKGHVKACEERIKELEGAVEKYNDDLIVYGSHRAQHKLNQVLNK